MKLFSAFCLSIVVSACSAQAFKVAWNKSGSVVGGQQSRVIKGLIRSDGGYVLGGNQRIGNALGLPTLANYSRSGSYTSNFTNSSFASQEVSYVGTVGSSGDVLYAGHMSAGLGENPWLIRSSSVFGVTWARQIPANLFQGKERIVDGYLDEYQDNITVIGYTERSAGVHSPFVARYRLSDGATVWSHELASTTFDASGEISGISEFDSVFIAFETNGTLGFAKVNPQGQLSLMPNYVPTSGATRVRLHGYIGETERNIVLITEENAQGQVKNGLRALDSITSADEFATFPTSFGPRTRQLMQLVPGSFDANQSADNLYAIGWELNTSVNRNQLVVQKFNGSGGTKWTKTLLTNENVLPNFGPRNAFAMDKFEEIYVGFGLGAQASQANPTSRGFAKFSLTGTPRFNTVRQLTGQDDFEFSSLGVHNDSGDVLFLAGNTAAGPQFSSVQQAPVAINDGFTVRANTNYLTPRSVTKNDRFATGGTLSVFINPQHGSLQLLGNGQMRFIPVYGFTGTDSATYRIQRAGVNVSMGTVTFNVVP